MVSAEIFHIQEINAPIERVFTLVHEPGNLKLWMEGVEEAAYTSEIDPENAVGATFTQRIREGGRVSEYRGEVTGYKKPRYLGIQIGNARLRMQVDYRFSPTSAGTRLEYVATPVNINWLVRPMSPLFGWLTRRILRKQMTNPKALAETSA